jgi:hypothetical protein
MNKAALTFRTRDERFTGTFPVRQRAPRRATLRRGCRLIERDFTEQPSRSASSSLVDRLKAG